MCLHFNTSRTNVKLCRPTQSSSQVLKAKSLNKKVSVFFSLYFWKKKINTQS